MLLRLICPFRSHFNLNSYIILSQEETYCRFWQSVQSGELSVSHDLQNTGIIEYLHVVPSTQLGMRYQDIEKDSSTLLPEVIRIHPKSAISRYFDFSIAKTKKTIETEIDFSPYFEASKESSIFHIYDNTISIFEFSVEFPDQLLNEHCSTFLYDVQTWANVFLKDMIYSFYREVLFPFFVELWRLDQTGNFIQTPGQYVGFPDMILSAIPRRKDNHIPALQEYISGKPLWINRSLYLNSPTKGILREVVSKWIIPLDMGVDIFEYLQKFDFWLGWGNNAFLTNTDNSLAQNARESLLLAQYFYTALDCININLMRFIGVSVEALSSDSASDLSVQLQNIISAVDLLIIQFQDALRNLQGSRRIYFKDLAEKWDTEQLTAALHEKVTVCRQTVERIYEKRVKTSQTVIELLLFATGGVAILEFFATISAYGREMIASPAYGSQGDGIIGLLDIGRLYPPNLVLWFGVSFLALLFLAFVIVRLRIR